MKNVCKSQENKNDKTTMLTYVKEIKTVINDNKALREEFVIKNIHRNNTYKELSKEKR